MYESPIQVYVNDILNQIRQQEEDQIVAEVSQAVGINVEKEELIKALNYDRNQYDKGYEDGKKANKWIPVSERLPNEDECKTNNRLFIVSDGNRTYAEYFDVNKECFGEPTMEGFRVDRSVIAWQELPEPYKENENGRT